MTTIKVDSELTCPKCGYKENVTMPTDACLWFHECAMFHTLLKPQPGDCCVFCSDESVLYPPVQDIWKQEDFGNKGEDVVEYLNAIGVILLRNSGFDCRRPLSGVDC